MGQRALPPTGPHVRGTVELEAAFVLDVIHQVAPIEELHHKEQVVLWGESGEQRHRKRQAAPSLRTTRDKPQQEAGDICPGGCDGGRTALP